MQQTGLFYIATKEYIKTALKTYPTTPPNP